MSRAASLAIDIGSTCSRITVHCPSVPPFIHDIENPSTTDHPGLLPGEFTSMGFPMDNGIQYTGAPAVENRISTSLKPGIVLASSLSTPEKIENIWDYPHARRIAHIMYHNDTSLPRRFAIGLRELLLRLLEAAVELCDQQGYKIESFGVAIPGHWPCEVQDAYQDMVLAACKKFTQCRAITRDRIHFHSETQALAHFIFNRRLDLFREHHASRSRVIILDFGGQNLNISVYWVIYSNEEPKALYEICNSSGAAGGSEQHAELIGDYCERYCQNIFHLPGSDNRRQGYVNEFNRKKKALDKDHNGSKNTLCLTFEGQSVNLTPQIIRDKFEEVFRQPLEETERVLKEFSPDRQRRMPVREASRTTKSPSPPSPCVIVAGGSSRYKPLAARLKAMCQQYGIQPPILQDQIQWTRRFQSSAIAQGAAFATRNYMTISEYMERGAALGIQMRQAAPAGKKEADRTWDDEAKLHDRKPDSLIFKERTYDLQETDELKIVCHPMLEADSPSRTINYSDAYDVFHLGTYKAGQAKIMMGIFEKKNDMYLQISMIWRFTPAAAPLKGQLMLPLCFNRSSGCVIVTDDMAKRESTFPAEALLKPPEAPIRGCSSASCSSRPPQQGMDRDSAAENDEEDSVSNGADSGDASEPSSSSDEDHPSDDPDYNDPRRSQPRGGGSARGGTGGESRGSARGRPRGRLRGSARGNLGRGLQKNA